jgi:hypothetical protein
MEMYNVSLSEVKHKFVRHIHGVTFVQEFCSEVKYYHVNVVVGGGGMFL